MMENPHNAAIEAILFAAGEAVSLKHMATALGLDMHTTKKLILNLMANYAAQNRGIEIISLGESFQMRTHPSQYEFVKSLLQNPPKRTLTQPLIETLAIIAYQQPVTKAQIEEVRGVNADHAVNKLMEYGLVDEKGRQDSPGKPILFGTTEEFLRHYGFNHLRAMPPLPQINEQIRLEVEGEIQ